MSNMDIEKLTSEVDRLNKELASLRSTLDILTGEVPVNVFLAWATACTRMETFKDLKGDSSLDLRPEVYDRIATIGVTSAANLGLPGSLFDFVASAFGNLRGSDWPDSCPKKTFVETVYTKAK